MKNFDLAQICVSNTKIALNTMFFCVKTTLKKLLFRIQAEKMSALAPGLCWI